MIQKFQMAIEKIRELEKHDRYVGAYIFGSVARGDEHDKSDLDVQVIVNDAGCHNISHPYINGIKLDIKFHSIEQEAALMKERLKMFERVPMVAESIIVFDKTGELTALKKQYLKEKPRSYKKADHQFVRFMAYFLSETIREQIEQDSAVAQLGMHLDLMELLQHHYRIQKHWWLPTKQVFPDLASWDKPLAKLLRKFLEEPDVAKKYTVWMQMVHYILKPIGGWQEVGDNICDCRNCSSALAVLRG